jgi:hypothetical protein
MGLPDALLFMLLALADTALLVYLRRRRRQTLTLERMARCLQFAIERENNERRQARHRSVALLQRAS